MYFSSTSSTAMVASGARASAATRPASMLAPKALDATCWPSVPSAAVISRVVVVFPLVPVTRTTCRPRASSEQQIGLQAQPDDPADDRAVTAAGQPGGTSGRAAHRGGQPGAKGKAGPRPGGLLALISA